MVDVLTLNFNDADTTANFVLSIVDYNAVKNVVVVDNNSTDNSLDVLGKLSSAKVQIIASKNNGGYGAGNNLGIRHLFDKNKSKYILLANPDVIVDEITIQTMFDFLETHSDYAIVAPVMTDPNGNWQYNTAFKLPSIWQFLISFEIVLSKMLKPFYYKKDELFSASVVDVGAVSGSMFLMNTEKMVKYGMFDENVFLFYEEHILGSKLHSAKQKIALLTNLKFIHNHSISISKSYKTIVSRNRLSNKSRIYVLKHYYNANAFVLFIAWILSYVNLLESLAIDMLKKHK